MKILDLPQGSDLWKAERRRYATASDMPSILGVKGAFSNRKRLLGEKLTGDREPTEYQKVIFARGHEVEEELRKVAEKDLGMSLAPAVALDDKLGLLASIDCVNFDYGVLVETKNSRAESKLSLARQGIVWEPYRVQILAQMLVTKIDIAFLYMLDDNTGEVLVVPVEEDKKIMRKIGTEAKKFVKELHEQSKAITI
jgi:predicted phage-related endonuclease